MEHGFFHPDRGYWQTIGDVSANVRETYPKGTVEVPLRPLGNYEWDGVKWVEVAPLAPTADEIRAHRNALLAASDWTQVADAPVDQAAWATYRQALRDITTQVGFPHDVVWPEKPQ